MPVFNIGQHPDNAIYKFVFIHYDQRGHICPISPRAPSGVDTQTRPAASDSMTFSELPRTLLSG